MKLEAGNLSYYLQTKNANKYLPSICLLDSSDLVCNQNTELLWYGDDSIATPPKLFEELMLAVFTVLFYW